jgi:hypothetical protein
MIYIEYKRRHTHSYTVGWASCQNWATAIAVALKMRWDGYTIHFEKE